MLSAHPAAFIAGSTPDQLASLMDGRTHVNIPTAPCQDGEIRGRIMR